MKRKRDFLKLTPDRTEKLVREHEYMREKLVSILVNEWEFRENSARNLLQDNGCFLSSVAGHKKFLVLQRQKSRGYNCFVPPTISHCPTASDEEYWLDPLTVMRAAPGYMIREIRERESFIYDAVMHVSSLSARAA